MSLYYDIEFRADGSALSGLAVPFGQLGTIVKAGRLLRERVRPGALSWADVVLSRGHDPATAMARTPDSLVVAETAEGIVFRAEPPDTTLFEDTRRLIKAGVLRGVSIEFRAIEEAAEAGVRVITKGELLGISIVSRAAYPQTMVQARSKRRYWL